MEQVHPHVPFPNHESTLPPPRRARSCLVDHARILDFRRVLPLASSSSLVTQGNKPLSITLYHLTASFTHLIWPLNWFEMSREWQWAQRMTNQQQPSDELPRVYLSGWSAELNWLWFGLATVSDCWTRLVELTLSFLPLLLEYWTSKHEPLLLAASLALLDHLSPSNPLQLGLKCTSVL